MPDCDIDCKKVQRLEGQLEKKANRSGVWQAIGLTLSGIILLWAIVTWALADGQKMKTAMVEENKKHTEENRAAIVNTDSKITVIGIKLELMQSSNEKLSQKVEALLKEIRNDKPTQPNR